MHLMSGRLKESRLVAATQRLHLGCWFKKAAIYCALQVPALQ
jgi:hypothetical protein